MATLPPQPYAARLNIDYPEKLDRLTTLLRIIWIIPIAIILGLLSGGGNQTVMTDTGGRVVQSSGGGISGGLWLATVRSEERRVGKECGGGGGRWEQK